MQIEADADGDERNRREETHNRLHTPVGLVGEGGVGMNGDTQRHVEAPGEGKASAKAPSSSGAALQSTALPPGGYAMLLREWLDGVSEALA